MMIPTSSLKAEKTLPNIIVLLADDMGYGDPGFNGTSQIPTPNMDRLAGEGMNFTDAHATSALCTPSRYSLLTGRYAWRTGLKERVLGSFSPPLIDTARPTLGSFLKQNGYTTGAVGKWHLGLDWAVKPRTGPSRGDGWNDPGNIDYTRPVRGGPVDLGFDYFYGIAGSLNLPPWCFIENDRVTEIPELPVVRPESFWEGTPSGTMTESWSFADVDVKHTEKAVEFIEEAAGNDDPFFLYFAPSAPHSPWIVPEFMKGASGIGDRGDLVALLDWMVGQLEDVLKRTGTLEDTLFIISSDNGGLNVDSEREDHGHLVNGNLKGFKSDIFEGGHRIPLVLRWPGQVEGGTLSDELVSLVDLFATFADLVGEAVPEEAEDSISFYHLFQGDAEESKGRSFLVNHSALGRFALREDHWKLVDSIDAGNFSNKEWSQPAEGEPEGMLFNLLNDLHEDTNLWDEKPERVNTMLDKLHGLQDGD